MMPAAVVIATVADPVATRINAATSQPRSRIDTFELDASSAIAPPDAAVDEHPIESATGANDEKDRRRRAPGSRC